MFTVYILKTIFLNMNILLVKITIVNIYVWHGKRSARETGLIQ